MQNVGIENGGDKWTLNRTLEIGHAGNSCAQTQGLGYMRISPDDLCFSLNRERERDLIDP